MDRSNVFTTEDAFQEIMKEEHEICAEALNGIKKYLTESRGLEEE